MLLLCSGNQYRFDKSIAFSVEKLPVPNSTTYYGGISNISSVEEMSLFAL